jgi:hypothetical protein
MPGTRVGIMMDGTMPSPTRSHLVLSLIQTLASLPDRELDAFLSHFGLIIFDECHNYATQCYARVVNRCNALGILGLTATPRAGDRSYILDYLFGPTVVQEDRPPLYGEFKVVVYNRGRRPLRVRSDGSADIFAITADLTEDVERNDLIARVILDIVWSREPQSPLPPDWLSLRQLGVLGAALHFHEPQSPKEEQPSRQTVDTTRQNSRQPSFASSSASSSLSLAPPPKEKSVLECFGVVDPQSQKLSPQVTEQPKAKPCNHLQVTS